MNWLGGAKKRLRLMGCSSQNYDVSNFKKSSSFSFPFINDYLRKQVKLSEKTHHHDNLQNEQGNKQAHHYDSIYFLLDPLFNRFYYKDQLLPKYLSEKPKQDEEEKRSPLQQQGQASEHPQNRLEGSEEKRDKVQLESFKFKKRHKNRDILFTEPKKSSKMKIWTTSNSELKTRSDIKEIFRSSSFTGPLSAVLRSESKRNKELGPKPNFDKLPDSATEMDFR